MGYLTKITKEYFGEDTRKEDEKLVKINIDGNVCLFNKDDYPYVTDLEKIGENGELYVKKEFGFLDGPVYVFLNMEKGKWYDYYFLKDETIEETGGGLIENGMTMFASADYDLMDDNFLVFDIIKEAGADDHIDFDEGDFVITKDRDRYRVEGGSNSREFEIYTGDDAATNAAYECMEDLVDSEYGDDMEPAQVERFMGFFGHSWIDDTELNDWFVTYYCDRFDDDRYSDGEHGSVLFDTMIDNGLIEASDDYFEIDRSKPKFKPEDYRDKLVKAVMDDDEVDRADAEDIVDSLDEDDYIEKLVDFSIVKDNMKYFELDYSMPVFDVEEKINKLVNSMMDSIDTDLVDEYVSMFGTLESRFYHKDILAQKIVDNDGRGSALSSYDGKEYECMIDGEEYFVYVN